MRNFQPAMALMALILFGSHSFSQRTGSAQSFPKKTAKKKSELEQLIEAALKNHPDIQVAEAKAQAAAAELKQAKSRVVQEVVQQHFAMKAQARAVVAAEERLAALEKLKGAVGLEEINAAREALINAKAKLEQLRISQEHQWKNRDAIRLWDYRTGKAINRGLLWLQAQQRYDLTLRDMAAVRSEYEKALAEFSRKAKSPMVERIRKAMAMPVSVKHKGTPLTTIIEDLSRKTRIPIQLPGSHHLTSYTVELEGATLQAVLEWLEDQTGMRFVVRSYGLLMAPSDRLPPGGIPLHMLNKSDAEKPKKKQP